MTIYASNNFDPAKVDGGLLARSTPDDAAAEQAVIIPIFSVTAEFLRFGSVERLTHTGQQLPQLPLTGGNDLRQRKHTVE